MRATAMYFINVLALQAGNEEGEGEADTVSCVHCVASRSHSNRQIMSFSTFLGRSRSGCNKVAVDEQVFKNVKWDKEDSDELFDRVNVSVLHGPFCVVYTDAEDFCRIHIARLSEQALAIVHEGP